MILKTPHLLRNNLQDIRDLVRRQALSMRCDRVIPTQAPILRFLIDLGPRQRGRRHPQLLHNLLVFLYGIRPTIQTLDKFMYIVCIRMRRILHRCEKYGIIRARVKHQRARDVHKRGLAAHLCPEAVGYDDVLRDDEEWLRRIRGVRQKERPIHRFFHVKHRVIIQGQILAHTEYGIGQQDALLEWFAEVLDALENRRGLLFRKGALTEDAAAVQVRVERIELDGLHIWSSRGGFMGRFQRALRNGVHRTIFGAPL